MDGSAVGRGNDRLMPSRRLARPAGSAAASVPVRTEYPKPTLEFPGCRPVRIIRARAASHRCWWPKSLQGIAHVSQAPTGWSLR